jgi:hypothetical protein
MGEQSSFVDGVEDIDPASDASGKSAVDSPVRIGRVLWKPFMMNRRKRNHAKSANRRTTRAVNSNLKSECPVGMEILQVAPPWIIRRIRADVNHWH